MYHYNYARSGLFYTNGFLLLLFSGELKVPPVVWLSVDFDDAILGPSLSAEWLSQREPKVSIHLVVVEIFSEIYTVARKFAAR